MTDSEQLEPIDVQVQRPGIAMRILMRPLTLGIVLFAILLAFLYANLLYTPPLRISRETTYITEPLTSDGARVDYFAAFEQHCYRPEMKTDDNGYRLIVRALGPGGESSSAGAKATERDESRAREIYEKLGLDPDVVPTWRYEEPFDFLTRYAESQQLDETQRDAIAYDLDKRAAKPWTLTDLPMMESWLKQHFPVVELLGEAARRPYFIFARARPGETRNGELVDYDELSRFRGFSRILTTHANYCIGTGDVNGAMDDAVTCLRLGRHMQRHGPVIELLVGKALEGVARNIGIAGNRDCPPSAEQLRRYLAELNSLPATPPLAENLHVERYWLLNFAQGLAHGDVGPALLQMQPNVEETSGQVLAKLSVDWNVVMEEINLCLDQPDKDRGLHFPTTLTVDDLFLRSRSQRISTLIFESDPSWYKSIAEATHRSDCTENLQRITLAMLCYECEHGTLPPAFTTDASGKPLHSWRTLLLPYLGQSELHAKLLLNEPWDSPHNSEFHMTALSVYQCPSASLAPGLTTYSVVVGDKTAFGAGQGRVVSDFGDRLLLVVERKHPVLWMDPSSDLVSDEAVSQFGMPDSVGGAGSPHPVVFNVVLRSGAVRQFSKNTDPTVWQGLLEGTLDHDDY